jgi:hypothetical protein
MIELKPYDGLTRIEAVQQALQWTKDTLISRRVYPVDRAGIRILSLATGVFVFIGLCGIQGTASSSTRAMLCGGLIVSFLALAFLPAWLWQRQLRQWVGEPSLFVSSTDGYIHPGDTLEIVFQQPIERDMVLEYTRIELFERHLTKRRSKWLEKADNRQGDITDIQDQMKEIKVVESQPVKKGDIYKQEATFTLPDHMTPNFVSGNIAYVWYLRVTCQCPGFEQLTHLYPLPFPPKSKRKEL